MRGGDRGWRGAALVRGRQGEARRAGIDQLPLLSLVDWCDGVSQSREALDLVASFSDTASF